MPENQPVLVSVIMPAFNVQMYIAEAIESVMKQNVPDIELLVVDDESVDDTVKVVKDKIRLKGSRIRLIEQKNRGVSGARNTAIQQALGRFITFLDGDDIWPDDVLRAHVDLLSTTEHVSGVSGMNSSFKHTDQVKQFDLQLCSPPFRNSLLGSSLFRKEVFETVGMFDETLTHGEDTDWFLRASELGITFAQSDRIALYYRRRAGSLTDRKASATTTLLHVLKKSINRKKAIESSEGASNCSTSA